MMTPEHLSSEAEVKLWNEIYQRVASAMDGMNVPVDALIGVLACFIGGAIASFPNEEGRRHLHEMFLKFVEIDIERREGERRKSQLQ